MAKDKKPTKEETEAAEKAKAQSREYSLKNLDVKSSISGIAAAYLADKKMLLEILEMLLLINIFTDKHLTVE